MAGCAFKEPRILAAASASSKTSAPEIFMDMDFDKTERFSASLLWKVERSKASKTMEATTRAIVIVIKMIHINFRLIEGNFLGMVKTAWQERRPSS